MLYTVRLSLCSSIMLWTGNIFEKSTWCLPTRGMYFNSFIRSSIHPSDWLSVSLSVSLSVYSFIHPSIHPSINMYVCPFIHSFIHSFIYSFIQSFVRSFIYSSTHPLICLSIHSFIHSFICSFHFLPSTVFIKPPLLTGWLNHLFSCIYLFLHSSIPSLALLVFIFFFLLSFIPSFLQFVHLLWIQEIPMMTIRLLDKAIYIYFVIVKM